MKNENNTNRASGGIGFVGLLTILFIALKLIGVINWSWIWVLSPIWISAISVIAICILVVLIYLLLLAISYLYKHYKQSEYENRFFNQDRK